MSEVSEFRESPGVAQTAEGKWQCLACGRVLETWEGWRAHILQRRCEGRKG